MKRTALLFGGIAALLVFIYGGAVFGIMGTDFKSMSAHDFQTMQILGYARYLILIVGVFMAMRSFKKEASSKEGNAGVSYGSVVLIGIGVSAVVAIAIGAAECSFMLMNPNFIQDYGTGMMNSMRAQGVSEQVIQQSAAEMQRFSFVQNPLLVGVYYFFETFVIGAISALIFAFFLKSPVAQTAKAEYTAA